MQVAAARRFLLLSSILRACNVCCKHQTSDCKERIEKLNITHLHHLRFCTPSRRKTTRRPYLPTRLIISQKDKKFNQYLPSPIAFTTSYGAPIIRTISGYFKPWLWSVLIFLSKCSSTLRRISSSIPFTDESNGH